MPHKTAILIFSRLPQEEALCKSIAQNNKNSLAVWQHLYNQTIATAAKTTLPVILCSEDIQKGKNFAEKITNSIAKAFGNGYDSLIVIGSDTPNLLSSHLNFAKNELLHGREIVAGKDMRGGIYLLGLRKSSFNVSTFLKFSWQTNRLFHEINEYAGQFNFSTLSTVLYDINTKADAQKSLSLFNTKQTLKILLINISALIQKQLPKITTLIPYPIPVQPNILRGPPSGL